MVLAGLIQRAKFLLNDNSGTILTGMGISGTVATAYLSGRASFRAAQIIEEEKLNTEVYDSVSHPMTTPTKAKLVWRLYIPSVSIGVITILSIVMAHKLSTKKIAALAVASGISERALQEYKAKVVERLGDRQNTKIRDEIAQDRVNKTSGAELVIAGDGKVLCMDMLTGRYFMSSSEELKRAENKINHVLNTQMGASLSEFYEEIGLNPTAYSEHVGWNPDKLVELKISATLAADGRPCLAVDYEPHPFENYWRLHE